MEESDPTHWKPHDTALVEALEEWEGGDTFKEIFAREVMSYLKPRWSPHETLHGYTGTVR